MGQHTWFKKNKKLYEEQMNLYKKLYSHEIGKINLDENELKSLHMQINAIDKENEVKQFNNIFRTSKRDENNCYIDEVIVSRKQCLEWIEDEKNLVRFSFPKDEVIQKINEFWDKYPDGLIYFG